MLSNQASNSGKKWAHFAILRVVSPAKLGVGKQINGLRVAAVAASLRKSRRVGCVIRFRFMIKAISLPQPNEIADPKCPAQRVLIELSFKSGTSPGRPQGKFYARLCKMGRTFNRAQSRMPTSNWRVGPV